MADLPILPLKKEKNSFVKTGDSALDRMVQIWLPWQIRKCRIEGRTGFYQCGGAWGFRDQIQDVSAFLRADSALVRRHILRCAAVQFPEGDVLHWWHRLAPEDGGLRGVRTRYRDDLLWLPWLVGQYVSTTNDQEILTVKVPFVEGEPLTDNEKERYAHYCQTSEKYTIADHCQRAIVYALQKGEHGLLLMGGGDWNDGMNQIGIRGRGESVWLTMFMVVVLEAFSPCCSGEVAEQFKKEVGLLRSALEEHAWDGDHYLRAFTDDGVPVGKSGAEECAVDSITQSFALYAGLDENRVQTALTTALKALVDKEKGIIKLLWPPFSGNG
ncbi:MAG: cellobiose phosphorylase, partial [Clostridia bacterium]|nr:cellobiose phosphorylase [Clostridia bacterium]